jgi:hypothetical protein
MTALLIVDQKYFLVFDHLLDSADLHLEVSFQAGPLAVELIEELIVEVIEVALMIEEAIMIEEAMEAEEVTAVADLAIAPRTEIPILSLIDVDIEVTEELEVSEVGMVAILTVAVEENRIVDMIVIVVIGETQEIMDVVDLVARRLDIFARSW